MLQFTKALEKSVTKVHLSNSPEGIEVIEVQPLNTFEKTVTPVHLSNNPEGIVVSEVQFRNVLAKLVNPVIPKTGVNIAVNLLGLVGNNILVAAPSIVRV
jgi:hypothetical protein